MHSTAGLGRNTAWSGGEGYVSIELARGQTYPNLSLCISGRTESDTRNGRLHMGLPTPNSEAEDWKGREDEKRNGYHFTWKSWQNHCAYALAEPIPAQSNAFRHPIQHHWFLRILATDCVQNSSADRCIFRGLKRRVLRLTACTANILFELVCRICESDNEYDAPLRTQKVSEDDLRMRDPQTTAHILQQDMLFAISWREPKPFRIYRGGKAQVDHMVQFNEPCPSLLQESAFSRVIFQSFFLLEPHLGFPSGATFVYPAVTGGLANMGSVKQNVFFCLCLHISGKICRLTGWLWAWASFRAEPRGLAWCLLCTQGGCIPLKAHGRGSCDVPHLKHQSGLSRSDVRMTSSPFQELKLPCGPTACALIHIPGNEMRFDRQKPE